MALGKDVVEWYSILANQRTNFDNLWQEIIDYMIPTKKDITTTRSPGEKKTRSIFDSTGTYGHAILSEFIQGAVFNPATKWFSQKPRDERLEDSENVGGWLNHTSEQMLNAFQYSNFYGAAGEAVEDWTAFGNCAMLIEDATNKREGSPNLRYTSIPSGTYVWGEGTDGKVDKFIRCVKMKLSEAYKEFGDKLSADLLRILDKEPFRDVEFYHSIMPRDFVGLKKNDLVGYKGMPYSSCWVEKEKKKLVREGGYRKFPVAVARWKVLAGEVYGRGPGEIALPDVRTLNKSDEMALLVWARELDPPQKVKQGTILGNINLRPGSHTLMTDVNGMVPLYEGSKLDTHTLLRDDKRQSVLRIFHVSEILNLVAREKLELTATEVQARLNLLQQILGPTFGRYQSEFLSVVIDVTFDNMFDAGQFEEPPEELLIDNRIDVVYEGPLAKAQRNQEILQVQSYQADIAQIGQFSPPTVQLVNWEMMARALAKMRGVQHLIRDKAGYNEAVAQMAKIQELQQQLAVMESMTKSLKQATPFIQQVREGGAGAGGQEVAV